QQMIDEFGLTQDGLSKSISKSRPQITNTLRLLKLPPSVQKKVSSGVLSAGHARALLTLPDEKSMTALADKIIAEGLSVRSTEELVALQTGQTKKRAKKPRVNAWVDSPVRQDLESRFDTKVAIKGTKKHGKIEIVFSSPEDMDRIVAILLEKDQSASNSSHSGDKGWV
ncbi:MAG: ParB/RepB/Spo0J family partition protein, partial [Bifidobacteriales bacterium]|nr:ParB/RepB/Spo0J family partition protein [Bifidobacteriales bacterium]